jgi:predicted RNase H-like HicB family nuclease
MSKSQFTTVISKKGRWYVGTVAELPGSNTQGRTVSEVKRNLKEAISLILDARLSLETSAADTDRNSEEANAGCPQMKPRRPHDGLLGGRSFSSDIFDVARSAFRAAAGCRVGRTAGATLFLREGALFHTATARSWLFGASSHTITRFCVCTRTYKISGEWNA